MTFNVAFDRLIGHEGGYVDHPDDKGGKTKYGITQARYPSLDIAKLTLEDARAIYKVDFWDRYDIVLLPEKYRYLMFDMYVNHNPRAAAKILQRAIINKAESQGFEAPIEDDGVVGMKTLGALREYRPEPWRLLVFRAAYYVHIVLRNPSQKAFIAGWLRQRVFEEYRRVV